MCKDDNGGEGVGAYLQKNKPKKGGGGARAHAGCTATRASPLGEGAGTPGRPGTGTAGGGRAHGHQGTRAALGRERGHWSARVPEPLGYFPLALGTG